MAGCDTVRNTVPIVSILFVLILLSASVGTSFSITSSVTSYDNTITVVGPDPDPVPKTITVDDNYRLVVSDLPGYELTDKNGGPISNCIDDNWGLETIITITEDVYVAVYFEFEEESPIFINVHYKWDYRTFEVKHPANNGYVGKNGKVNDSPDEAIHIIYEKGKDESGQLMITLMSYGKVRISIDIVEPPVSRSQIRDRGHGEV